MGKSGDECRRAAVARGQPRPLRPRQNRHNVLTGSDQSISGNHLGFACLGRLALSASSWEPDNPTAVIPERNKRHFERGK